ncbi:hypothetical protein [Schlesneria paludicola]|uniref:hypothetical protein n=1 Tax=Schlesneria paludicola TaxID=360056 RepID=UPI00029B377A|nr:hypothetical protein [Schlesneria paludicola]
MIAEFSLLLICGMSLMWCMMPRAQVTAGFFRIQMLIVIGLSALGLLTMGQLTATAGQPLSPAGLMYARIALGIALVSAYAGSIFWLLGRRRPGTIAMICVMAATLVSLISSRGGVNSLMTAAGALRFLSSFATAAVLGSTVTGMLLGHWYLTAPTMSIQPLRTLSWFLVGAVLLRLSVSVVGWMSAGEQLHGGTQWTWFALRWLAGILGPLVISVLALRILRYRNTQAATGVLFAGVILVFIGEMSAALLYSELRVPF